MLGEVRGPFGEHYGYVRVQPDVTGLGVIMIIALIGVAAFNLLEAAEQVMRNPGEHSWVHIFSTHFYYFTSIFPLKLIGWVWGAFTYLTPWDNLNFVLAILIVPISGLFYVMVLMVLWGMATRAIGLHPVFAYLLPSFLSGAWEGGRWLFA